MKSETIRRIPIITYHSLDRSGSVISTSPEIFRRQMKFLSENGCRAISLEKLIEYYKIHKNFPPETVVLTFDDGFQNVYTQAFPVLAEYDFSATIFVISGYCGKLNNWAGNPPKLPREKLLNWRELKELSDRGFEIGAHTKTHPDLTKLEIAEAEKEIIESKLEIEEKIGRKAVSFAYPYGKFGSRARQTATAHFEAACSVKLGKADLESDFYSLERLDSYYLQDTKIFEKLFDRRFDFYIGFRRILRDFKSLAVAN